MQPVGPACRAGLRAREPGRSHQDRRTGEHRSLRPGQPLIADVSFCDPLAEFLGGIDGLGWYWRVYWGSGKTAENGIPYSDLFSRTDMRTDDRKPRLLIRLTATFVVMVILGSVVAIMVTGQELTLNGRVVAAACCAIVMGSGVAIMDGWALRLVRPCDRFGAKKRMRPCVLGWSAGMMALSFCLASNSCNIGLAVNDVVLSTVGAGLGVTVVWWSVTYLILRLTDRRDESASGRSSGEH
jgi:hypothetical protein